MRSCPCSAGNWARLPILRLLDRQLAAGRRSPPFALLLLASSCSGVGTWLAIVALNVDVLARTSSGLWLAALNSAALLPAAFIGLVGAPLVDRLSRKALMICSDVLRLAVFALLPFVDRPGAIVLLALVAGVGDAFFRPAVLAGVPNLVPEEELPRANYVLQASQWLTTAAGPLLGGALVAASGPDLAYWVNAASFGLSALLLARIPARLLQSDRPLSRGHLRDLVDGISLVRTSYPLLVVFVVWNVAMVASGGINVSEVMLAEDTFGAGAFGYGLLWAASGAGLVVGGWLFAGRARRSVATAYPGAIAVFGLAIGAAAIAPNVWVAAVAMIPAGIGNGVAAIANITLVQAGAPDRLRGRAFTLIMGVNFAVLGLAMLGGGTLAEAVGARWVWGGCAVVLLVAGLVARVLARRLDVDGGAPGEALEPPAPVEALSH